MQLPIHWRQTARLLLFRGHLCVLEVSPMTVVLIVQKQRKLWLEFPVLTLTALSPVLSHEMMNVGVESVASLCRSSIPACLAPDLRAASWPCLPCAVSWWHLLLWSCNVQALLNLSIVKFLQSCLSGDPVLRVQHRILWIHSACIIYSVGIGLWYAVGLNVDGTREHATASCRAAQQDKVPLSL